MNDLLINALTQLTNYGPGALVGIVFAILYFLERKRCYQLSDKLTELASASIKADMEHTKVYETNMRVLDSIDRRLS